MRKVRRCRSSITLNNVRRDLVTTIPYKCEGKEGHAHRHLHQGAVLTEGGIVLFSMRWSKVIRAKSGG